ncbi:hypothetical protein LF1_21290 [Rubripirellula obstinata]|uniref:Uncharacterized protein n=1 Tax=Rubripirellula obstinata TaxID=406547 RepID=A0A5B1CI21_9BACT|nr:hypothetical protein [Rubripirellula obstinata]KAA1259595.1 hypothetical protein LF1_21290 [Rubripirellula obstinata]
MNDKDFKILVSVAKLPKSERDFDIAGSDKAMCYSVKRLKGLSKDVLHGLVNGGCKGSAAAIWLKEVCREAKSGGTSKAVSESSTKKH